MAEREDTNPRWVKEFILTWLNRFGCFLAHHLTRPILPLYLVSFGASSTVIGAVMAIFTVTATIARVPIGLMIDRLGRKPFLLYGVALFAAGNLGYLWAPSILLVIPFRILHGIGWSGCTTAVATLAADIAPQKRRGELIGYAGMASSLGGAIGPIAGFALLHRFHFTGVFLGAVSLLFISLLLGGTLPEPARSYRNKERTGRWLEAVLIRETLLPAITVGFLSFGHGGILTFLPIHALKIGLENPGIWFTVYAGCLLLSRPIAGPLSDRISRRAVIIPGLILNLLGMCLLAAAPSPAWLIAAAIVAGLGTGAAQPALMTVAVAETTPQRRGQSMAQYQCFYDLGIGIGSLILGALLDLVGQNFAIMYLTAAGIAGWGLWLYMVKGKRG